MKRKIIFTSFLVILLLAACGGQATPAEPTPDVAAVRTSAASTVVSQFTLTAAVFTPTVQAATETPEAEETVAATQEPSSESTAASGTEEGLCDLLSYDPATIDVNIPDNTLMTPGQEFIKTWRVKNAGTCPWGAGYALTFTGTGDKMAGQFIAFTEVIQPGQEVEVSIQFKAPSAVGQYVSTWTMTNPKNVTFPEAIYVKIIVQ
ncbi:MAG: NBR1-Ig-like domain-containing protein [Anaerolineales bacterium]|nr:MAG: NBR1-Ig-like domain-containing protein [Anaerolineales bacterium]